MNAERSLYMFFKSVRLAVVLIGIVVVLSHLATLVPQGRTEPWYQARYSAGALQAFKVLHLENFFSSAIFLVPVCSFTMCLTFIQKRGDTTT